VARGDGWVAGWEWGWLGMWMWTVTVCVSGLLGFDYIYSWAFSKLSGLRIYPRVKMAAC
jgi:hypothetical protein